MHTANKEKYCTMQRTTHSYFIFTLTLVFRLGISKIWIVTKFSARKENMADIL